MSNKNHKDELLLLGILFLAFFNKGPLATTGPRGPPGEAGARGSMGDTGPPGQSSSPGDNGSQTDMGTTSKQPPTRTDDTVGVPDKSKTQSPPPSMPPMTMPPFMMPSTVDLINPSPPKGGMTLPSGSVFVPGLDLYGNPTGGPGPGASTPSITTRYGETTYTNFNPGLFVGANPKTGGPTIPETVKQPMPPMMMPVVMYSDPTQIQRGRIIPVDIPPPSKYVIPFMESPPMIVQQLPPGKTTVPNPMTQSTPDLLSMILKQTGGFGQEALSALLQGGRDLSGAFSHLTGLFSPGPITVPRITVDPFVV